MATAEYESLSARMNELSMALPTAPEADRSEKRAELNSIASRMTVIEVSEMTQDEYDTWIITH